MVGSAMAIDLSTSFKVTVADVSADALARLHKRVPAIAIVEADLRDEALLRWAA